MHISAQKDQNYIKTCAIVYRYQLQEVNLCDEFWEIGTKIEDAIVIAKGITDQSRIE